MLGYWFVVNFLSGTTTAIAETHQTLGGIAFWAHVGGFVAGLVFINIFAERPQRYRYGTW
jgi:membrane associated rhomboid family serine protease